MNFISKTTCKTRMLIPIYLNGIVLCIVIIGYFIFTQLVSEAKTSSDGAVSIGRQVQLIDQELTDYTRLRSRADKVTSVIKIMENKLLDYKMDTDEISEKIAAVRVSIDEMEVLFSDSKEIESKFSVLINESVSESNSYMPYIIGKLKQDRFSASSLEIDTIVGANKSTDTNYKIHLLFLNAQLGKSDFTALQNYLDDSLTNIRKDISALAGTPFENSPKKALVTNQQIKELVILYQQNSHRISILQKGITTNLDKINEYLLASNTQSINLVFNSMRVSFNAFIITMLIFTVITSLLSLWLIKAIIGPVSALSEATKQLASGNADLTIRFKQTTQDEIGLLVGNFNIFMDSMQKLMTSVRDTTLHAGDSSKLLSHLSNETFTSMKSQQLSTELAVTATTEMSSTVQEIARNANETAENAKNAGDQSRIGRESVKNVVAIIQELAGQVDSIGRIVKRFDHDSKNISAVLNVIRSISEQTNLLALNAAIEAARAGEHGKGFAVVADEVRSLAAHTQSSIEEISETISSLQQSSGEAVKAMELGQIKTEATISKSMEMDNLLEAITNSIEVISDRTIQIATAVEEQSTVADSISESIDTIKTLTDQTTEQSKQTNQASSELQTVSTDLMERIHRFKL